MTMTMTTEGQPRLYMELATWWPLFSPPSEYVEEAADRRARAAHDSHGLSTGTPARSYSRVSRETTVIP